MSTSFYLHKPAPEIFYTIIKELAAGVKTASVPVMTNVGMDIFARLLQMPLLLVANQSSTKLNCCFKVLGVTISLDSGRVKLGCDFDP
jgi:hypothetical protein